VRPLHHAARGGEVLLHRQRRAVEHHRREAERQSLVDQRHVGGVVQVHHDRHGGGVGDLQHRPPDRGQRAVVADGVLADLEHGGAAGGLGAGHDRLGVLELDDVEGAYAGARPLRRGQDVGQCCAGHGVLLGSGLPVAGRPRPGGETSSHPL
jgi:hypothetical protein